jgi:hypothetical protein
MVVPARGDSYVSPATYTIRAQGRLAPGWSIRADSSLTFSCGTRQFPIAVICGRLSSQDDLLSVIEDLYDLGLPLLSLTVVGEETAGAMASVRDMTRGQQ